MHKTLSALTLATLATFSQATVAQVGQVIDWAPSGQSGTLGDISVQVSGTYYTGAPIYPDVQNGASVANVFSAPWFAGPLSMSEALTVNIPAQSNFPIVVSHDFVFSFSRAVQDVRVSLGSFASKAIAGNEFGWMATVRESGQAGFTTTSCTLATCIFGALSNASIPNDANGTVLIPGVSNQLRLRFSPVLLGIPDGVWLQISATPTASPVPEPASWALLLAGGAALLRRAAHTRAQRRV